MGDSELSKRTLLVRSPLFMGFSTSRDSRLRANRIPQQVRQDLVCASVLHLRFVYLEGPDGRWTRDESLESRFQLGTDLFAVRFQSLFGLP